MTPVFGDSEAEVQRAIADAKAASKTPRYVVVQEPKKQYLFTVFSLLLKSQSSLIVEGYRRLYIFNAATSHVYYSANPGTEITPNLPSVSAPIFDALTLAETAPAQFRSGNVAAKTLICPDCVALIESPQKLAAITSGWGNAARDFWQFNPDYVPWKRVNPEQLCYETCGTSGGSQGITSYGYGSGGGGAAPPPPGGHPSPVWHNTAERVCADQGGRFADYWGPVSKLVCQYPDDESITTVIEGDGNDGCTITTLLPPYAVGSIWVYVAGSSLNPPISFTTATGMRANLYTCYWMSWGYK
jgi:hypothetical protein